MKKISHRGNLWGIEKNLENNPTRIEDVLRKGFDCEVDLRAIKSRRGSIDLYLGHDTTDFLVTSNWLANNAEKLWIHCKNVEALTELANYPGLYNYFWHQNDEYTITSKGHVWVFPGNVVPTNGILVLPENNNVNLEDIRFMNIFGVCSDFIGKIK